jgi:hypothetical protein
MTVHRYTDANDALDETDFAIILDKDGHLKGVWMPPDVSVEFPSTIVEILKTHFKIEFDGNEDRKLH